MPKGVKGSSSKGDDRREAMIVEGTARDTVRLIRLQEVWLPMDWIRHN